MNELRIYNLKWQQDLELYMPVYGTFVIEGHINDLCPLRAQVPNGEIEYSYRVLPYAIAEQYKDKYCAVFLDQTKRETRVTEKLDAHRRPLKNERGESILETHFGSLEFYDAESNPENVKLLERYCTESFKKEIDEWLTSSAHSPLTRDIIRIREAMANYSPSGKTKPFMFILRNTSRFMVNPGEPSGSEYHALNTLFQTTQMDNTECKLIILVDKMNDLPTWFEAENSNQKIRKIFVANTDADFRQKFYLDRFSDVFKQNYSLLKRNPRNLDEAQRENYIKMRNDPEFKKHMKKFAAYTEGFSVHDLSLFKLFVEQKMRQEREIKSVDDIKSLVLEFKYGQATDPWRKVDLLQTIKKLPAEIKKCIVGQDKAIETITNNLLHAVTGISRIKDTDRRPKAIFFFAGPTGTGKTEIAKQIAANIFGSEDSMIRFDMSEFSASHTDSRLFGAPPGYVGYDAGGELTQAIKQNPFSLILFDEIEKANSKILDKFLQILGDGRLTDGKGETVYFTDTVIVFTSNCGITGFDWRPNPEATLEEYNRLKEEANTPEKAFDLKVFETMQRGLKAEMIEQFSSNEEFNTFVEACVKKGVEYYFTKILDPGKPELLGRIGSDNVIAFNFMSKDSANGLVKKIKKDYIDFVYRVKQLNLQIDDSVIAYVTSEVQKYDVLNLGARGIITRAENLLKTPIANYLADNEEIIADSTITLVMDGDKIEIR